MARLFDFECDTCGLKFEQMIDGNEPSFPCKRSACGGTGSRLLGGHVAPSRSPPERAPSVGDFVELGDGKIRKVVARQNFKCDRDHDHALVVVAQTKVGKA